MHELDGKSLKECVFDYEISLSNEEGSPLICTCTLFGVVFIFYYKCLFYDDIVEIFTATKTLIRDAS